MINLHRGQQDILKNIFIENSKKIIHIINCGRRFGKTYLLEQICLNRLYINNKKIIPFNTNLQIIFIGPKIEFIKTVFNEIINFTNDDKIESIDRIHYTIKFKNGNLIRFYSGEDISAGRGKSANLIIFDESAFFRKKNFDEILWNNLIPTLATMTKNSGDLLPKVLISSSFKTNWWHEFILDQKSKGINLITMSSDRNPLVDLEFIKRTGISESSFNEEFLCIPNTNENTFNIPENLISYNIPKLKNIYVSIDPGYSHDTCAVLIISETNGQINILEEMGFVSSLDNSIEKFNHVLSQLKNYLEEIDKKYKIYKLIIEKNGLGISFISGLHKYKNRIFSVDTTQKSKEQCVNHLKSLIYNNDIIFYNTRNLVFQINKYEMINADDFVLSLFHFLNYMKKQNSISFTPQIISFDGEQHV